MKKIRLLTTLVLVCTMFGMVTPTSVSAKVGKVWWGIGEIASTRGHAKLGARAAIGAIGILDAATWGFAVGMVAGPVGGAVAGIIAGA